MNTSERINKIVDDLMSGTCGLHELVINTENPELNALHLKIDTAIAEVIDGLKKYIFKNGLSGEMLAVTDGLMPDVIHGDLIVAEAEAAGRK